MLDISDIRSGLAISEVLAGKDNVWRKVKRTWIHWVRTGVSLGKWDVIHTSQRAEDSEESAGQLFVPLRAFETESQWVSKVKESAR